MRIRGAAALMALGTLVCVVFVLMIEGRPRECWAVVLLGLLGLFQLTVGTWLFLREYRDGDDSARRGSTKHSPSADVLDPRD